MVFKNNQKKTHVQIGKRHFDDYFVRAFKININFIKLR